jgi:hypothetical protein
MASVTVVGHTRDSRNQQENETVADVWSIKGISLAEREGITKDAREADVPIGRYLVRGWQCLRHGANHAHARPDRDIAASLDRFERLARLAHEISGAKDAASRTAKRILRHALEAESVAMLPSPSPKPLPAMIEGNAVEETTDA